jgi:DNA-binding winged helix-turn-helix (wHTH) protein
MSDRSVRQYIFGEFILEPQEERLSRINVERVELTGKPFEVLVLLVENQGHLVTRDALLAKVWPDTAVTDQSLTEVVSRIRKTLDPNNPERYIETVPRKGYRFVVPVSSVVDPVRAVTETLPHNEKRRLRLVALCLLRVLIAVGISSGILHFGRTAARESEIHYNRAIRLEAEGKDNLAIQELDQVQRPYAKFAEAKLRSAWLSYQADEDDEVNRTLCVVGNGNVSRAE